MLVGLGTWQVQRLHWKRAILAQISQAEAGPPLPLSAISPPYSKVEVTGQFDRSRSALYGAEVRETREGPKLGAQLIEPLIRASAPAVLVDRGWVPLARKTPLNEAAGLVMITGYVHPADKPGLFSPSDDVANRTFYTLNPRKIGPALGLHDIMPFTLVALGPQPTELWPDPAKHLPHPPNNHLSYAVTWYGLAAALVVIFLIWARRMLHA
ncbi:MAG: SURF1 family protein [Acetobacteraceae bacterium]|nr:SURF1 family protein [Acetobacteraceae bacterium]